MPSNTLHRLTLRHDGHEEKAKGYYQHNDDIVKYGFWVIVVFVVTLMAAHRLTSAICHRRGRSSYRLLFPNKTSWGRFWYRRCAFTGTITRHLNPPTLGQSLFLFLYWALILAGLWTNVIFNSPSEMYGIRWEVVGFRGAWVSTMQLPLLYLLGCRFNIISILTGITHERLNWFHCWVARTVFMTLIVHWSFFFREWSIAGFVAQEFEMMPMVWWGFAAWGAIGLLVITGFNWFREMYFEAWLLSHIVLAWAVLGLSYAHTRCTTYFVDASLGVLAFDMCGRGVSYLLYNTPLLSLLGTAQSKNWLFGNEMSVQLIGTNCEYLRLIIRRPRLNWKAGQHVYLSIPRLRLYESHPFTISNTRDREHTDLALVIKREDGFTKSLFDCANDAHSGTLAYRALIQGPYGNPPSLQQFDTVIFIATGNRASFNFSLLEGLMHKPGMASQVFVHWIIPSADLVDCYKEQIYHCICLSRTLSLNLRITIHLTRAIQTPLTDHNSLFALTDDIDSDGDSDCPSLHDGYASSHTLLEKSDSHISTNHLRTEKIEESATSDVLHGRDISAPLSTTTPSRSVSSMSTDVTLREDEEALLVHETMFIDLENNKEASNEKASDHLSIGYGRPSTRSLLLPLVGLDERPQRIKIVAAVPPTLATEVSRIVSSCEAGANHVELWTETNGS